MEFYEIRAYVGKDSWKGIKTLLIHGNNATGKAQRKLGVWIFRSKQVRKIELERSKWCVEAEETIIISKIIWGNTDDGQILFEISVKALTFKVIINSRYYFQRLFLSSWLSHKSIKNFGKDWNQRKINMDLLGRK